MRRTAWIGVVAVVVAGCTGGAAVTSGAPTTGGDAVTTTTARPADSLLYVGSSARLAAVQPDSGTVLFTAPGVIAAPDWSRLWRADASSDGTTISALDPSTGATTASGTATGMFTVRAVSGDGRTVALGPVAASSAVYPVLAEGRTSTVVAVARLEGDGATVSTQQWTVPANVEPEAFFADGSLAVIDFTPPEQPTGYRVRRLDPASGQLVDIETDDDEDMTGGSARTHVYSPDGTHLYTYYRIVDAEGARAFIHVLDLVHPSAHCVDLPAPFGSSGPSSTALSTSADGEHLYVSDLVTGAIADVDTQSRTVARVGQIGALESYGASAAAPGPGDTMYLSNGSAVFPVDTKTLTRGDAFVVPVGDSWVTSLRYATDGAAQLYVGMSNRVAVVDLASGTEARSIVSPWPDPTTEPITFLGPASPPLPASLSAVQCAC